MLQTATFAYTSIPFIITIGMLIAAILFWGIKEKYPKYPSKVSIVSCSAIFLVWLIISLNLIAAVISYEFIVLPMMMYYGLPFTLFILFAIVFPLEMILMMKEILEQIRKLRSSQQ